MFRMYVMAHKKVEQKYPSNYYILELNSANHKEHYGDFLDNDGANISSKNPNYCELTGLYWIWKNDHDSDIVGTCHYRRLFTNNRFSKKISSFLNEQQVVEDLREYDLIAPKLYKTKITCYEHLLVSCKEKDVIALRDTIKELYPDYLSAYDSVMNSKKSYLLNMMVMNKSLFDEYASFIFDILTNLENKVDLTGYTTNEARIFGFLSERLLTVFVKKKELKVKEYRVNNLEVSLVKKVIGKFTAVFKKH